MDFLSPSSSANFFSHGFSNAHVSISRITFHVFLFELKHHAISNLVNLSERNRIHPLVKRFCKGIAALKPPKPRYDYVWDPAPVLTKLSAIYPYDSCALKVITKKLALLLALGTGHRAQTLALLRILQISLHEKLIIRIPDRIKTSAPGRSQPFFCFSRFPNHESLCIVRLTEHYMERTKILCPAACDSFFISFNKPYKAVTVQTVSRWIRQGLEDCGIDMTVFSAHSTRHVATSQAAKKGVSLDLIKRATGWTGESCVFANFYHRPIVNPEDFSNAVLLP